MYHHPGEYVTDFCIVKHADLYHLFHIRGERWTWSLGYKELDLGHATSPDLQHWTPHDPVLPAGPPGAWDESGNWAPDIIEVAGVYYCYYTGSDANNNQAIGLAISTDLFHWTKYADHPVVAPGDWSDRHVGRDVAGRDAMVFHDAARNRYLLYYTATMADGRACLALAQSHDLYDWQDLGPTYIEEDRSYNRLESAYLVAHDDKYYLFYSAKGGPKSKGFAPKDFPHFDIVYVASDAPTSGWVKLANHELLTEWTCASEHPTFADTTYMFYIIQEEINGVWGASVLSDPKRIAWLPDGTVQIHEHLPAGVGKTMLFHNGSDNFSDWVPHGGGWQVANNQVSAPTSGGDAFWLDTLWGQDVVVEAEVLVEKMGVASLIVRGNPGALAGYRIGLDFERQVVGMYLRFPNRLEEVIQERKVLLQPRQWCKLKVVVQGAFFDVYVDEALILVRHHRLYVDGCFGLHAQGAQKFRQVAAYRYAGLGQQHGEWQYRCRPRYLFGK